MHTHKEALFFINNKFSDTHSPLLSPLRLHIFFILLRSLVYFSWGQDGELTSGKYVPVTV